MRSEDEQVVHVGYCLHCASRDGVQHVEQCTFLEPCETCREDGMGPVGGADPEEGHLLLASMPTLSSYFS
jgi:hypothetical protein